MIIDFGPRQDPITPERIKAILDWQPRRMVVGGPDWPDVLKAPEEQDKDWRIVLPFCETLRNAFEHGCGASSIGMREGKGRCWTFLKSTAGLSREDLVEVNDWLRVLEKYVAIRDGLCLSFALDFDRTNGDPNQDQTEIGRLRSRAKPYGGPSNPDVIMAANELVLHLDEFLEQMRSYRKIDAVVAMPPSRPDKPFDLPRYLVGQLASRRQLVDLSEHIVTVAERPQMKDVPKENKVDTLLGTVSAAPNVFAKRNVLLLDDLYQSGASANVVAMELLNAGAQRVYGLFCEKTCRNDDNLG